MSHRIKTISLIALGLIALLASYFYSSHHPSNQLPKIAIANWGPHASLHESIAGIKDELERLGLKENQDIRFEISDVNFDSSLIMQMLAKLKANQPDVLVAISTPVAQAAKGSVKNIPIVFSDITSPVEGGLLQSENEPQFNLTGASDKQDLRAFLQFAKQILPEAKRIGLLYSTGEANDAALVKMMQQAAAAQNMEVVLVPIEQAKDVGQRMQAFKGKVDFIYVGVSGAIQPSLPMIVSLANKMQIPVFNADSDAVKNHQVLASYGVSYYQVGVNTATIIYQILQGKDISTIPPLYPKVSDHHGFISKKVALKFGIPLPILANVTVVE